MGVLLMRRGCLNVLLLDAKRHWDGIIPSSLDTIYNLGLLYEDQGRVADAGEDV